MAAEAPPGRAGPGRRRPPALAAAGARAGFSLIEVLVALALAGALVFSVSRALSAAFRATRAPADVVGAANVAAALIEGMRARPDSPPINGPGRFGAFQYEIASEPAVAELLPSPVPPAPRDATGAGGGAPGQVGGEGQGGPQGDRPVAPPQGEAAGQGGGFGGANQKKPPVPYRVVVVVTAPSGRSVRLETVKLVPVR